MKADNVERMKRINEYKRLETIRKLKQNEQRADQIAIKKNELLMQRKSAAINAKNQRDAIVEAMEQVKITKKWSKASKTLNKAMGIGGKKGKKKSRLMKSSQSLPAIGSASGGGVAPGGGRPRETMDSSADPVPYESPYVGGSKKKVVM